jgi:hypothetical protein
MVVAGDADEAEGPVSLSGIPNVFACVAKQLAISAHCWYFGNGLTKSIDDNFVPLAWPVREEAEAAPAPTTRSELATSVVAITIFMRPFFTTD